MKFSLVAEPSVPIDQIGPRDSFEHRHGEREPTDPHRHEGEYDLRDADIDDRYDNKRAVNDGQRGWAAPTKDTLMTFIAISSDCAKLLR